MKRIALYVSAGSLLIAPAVLFGDGISGGRNPIFKTSIVISTVINRRGQVWSWAPRAMFNVEGPLPSGAQIAAEFFQPGNVAWVKYDCPTPAVAPGKVGRIECGHAVPTEQLKAITATGAFPFRITIRNELAGSNETLIDGRFNVKKFHAGPDLPANKGNFEYYVDYDWQLPIGFVWYPAPYRSADGVSYFDDYTPLYTAFTFKGMALAERDVEAHLFFEGREISNTKEHGHQVNDGAVSTSQSSSPYNYARIRLEFTNVFGFAKDTQAHPGYYLNQHPGEYEVKVLRSGHLARSLKFTVGADGKLVDNGIASANGILGPRYLTPAQVFGDTDGEWNREAWKTEALFGNPLKGFAFK